jgi:hypothetical protein
VLPLALTLAERRLVTASVVPACATGAVAGAYAISWSIAAPDDELFGMVVLTLIGFAPAWIVLAAGLRLARWLRGPWMDSSSLPLPTIVLALASPLVVATTAYDALGPADPWRWVSLLPVLSTLLALAAVASTLRRRWRRRDQRRWSPRRTG